MKYDFSSAGITANQMLTQIGIKTIEKEGKKYLVYNGHEMERPCAHRIEEKLLQWWNIEIIYHD